MKTGRIPPTVLVFVILCLLAIGTANAGVERTITSSDGVVYSIRFNSEINTVNVTGENPTNRVISTRLSIQIDDSIVADEGNTLYPNQSWNISEKIYSGIDVGLEEHTVEVSTFGSYTEFNFTMDVNTTNPGPIPTPYIKDVEITNGTVDGEPSAVANVTVANPSKQTYPTKLMVHTTETHGSFYPAAVPPGETRTITVELLDERGAKIGGEARLYTEGLNKREGAMDQVEFVGRADAETNHWNQSYRPVRPPWQSNPYRYRNSSISGGGGVLPDDDGTTLLYVAVGAVVFLWLVRKVR